MDAYDINGVAPEIGSRIALELFTYISHSYNKHSCKELRKYIILVRGRNNHNFVIV